MKLTQFVYIINSFNPIDFQKKKKKKLENQHGKSSQFKLKICISCLHDKVYIFGQIFMKLTQFDYLIKISTLLILKKKLENQHGKSSHFKLKICISCLHDKVYIFGRIFMKLTQFVYLIKSFNPIDFEKKKKIRKSVWEK